MATCALHNYLREKVITIQEPEEDDERSNQENIPRTDVTHTSRTAGGKYNVEVKEIRDTLASYFVGPGQIPFQWSHANL